ncbi:unnamed protein product [Effrenium voratum]|uniref:Hexose transporter 1 n=1 Tax=Effrenium voratum TaxID=2562239 RepID=A0AA36MU24_9DINO|nr:unnamed protein product [Effrenium voratum]CAJ1426132.1 unnamed protein product [Effrenium voratum]
MEESRPLDLDEPGAKLTAKQTCVRFCCVFFNVLSGFVNGYDICITTGILDDMDRDLKLCHDDGQISTCFAKEAVLSAVSLGALLSRLCCTNLAERFGRRAALFLADVLILTSLALQSGTRSISIFFVARGLVGMGMGLAFLITPIYLCEIAPRSSRGLFVCLNEVAVCVGCLAGLHISALDWMRQEWAWQKAVALAAVPAAVQLVFVCLLPESPRWYANRGDVDGVDRAIRALGLQAETQDLKAAARAAEGREDKSSCCWRHVSAWVDFKQPCSIAMGVASCNAFVGTLSVQAYAHDLLKLCQVEDPDTVLPLIGWMKLAGALLAMLASDSRLVGRRRLVIGGSLLCTLCDATLAVHLAFPNQFPPGLATASVVLRIFGWNAGYGGVAFVVISEVLPNAVRSHFAAQCQVVGSVIDTLIFQLFETMLFANSVATFVTFATINLISCLFAVCCLPDFRGQALEACAARTYGVLSEDVPNSPPVELPQVLGVQIGDRARDVKVL